jgi:hypothetical protein
MVKAMTLSRAIDDLIELVKAADERELCYQGAYCRGILHSERHQFDELDQRVYTLALAASLKDELPKPVDSEGLTFTPDAPLPLFFLGKTNLPGNWLDGIFSFVNEASWQRDLLLLRSLSEAKLRENYRADEDRPVAPDSFCFSGTTYCGLSPLPFAMLKTLWRARNRTLEFRDLAGPVWRDPAWPVTSDNVGQHRKTLNKFFDANALPFRVEISGDYVSLKSAAG